MIKPIPKRVLIHSATYYPYQGKDAYQKATYGDAVELLNVRFEPVKKTSLTSKTGMSSLGEQKDDTLTMFVDGVNSTPLLDYSEFDKIDFSGQNYIIREVRPYFGFGEKVHHWEIYLV